MLPAETGLALPLPLTPVRDKMSSGASSACVIFWIVSLGAGAREDCDTQTGSGWKVGGGIDGRTCFDLERVGVGPVARRSAVGGGRRGIMLWNVLRQLNECDTG